MAKSRKIVLGVCKLRQIKTTGECTCDYFVSNRKCKYRVCCRNCQFFDQKEDVLPENPETEKKEP